MLVLMISRVSLLRIVCAIRSFVWVMDSAPDYCWFVHPLVHALPFGRPASGSRQVLARDGGERRCDASPPRCRRRGGAPAESCELGKWTSADSSCQVFLPGATRNFASGTRISVSQNVRIIFAMLSVACALLQFKLDDVAAASCLLRNAWAKPPPGRAIS